jgi:glycine/D-amino acid oxidase-like deaminating enzyme
MPHKTSIPSSILIIGSGVFGLSTAHELAKHPFFRTTKLTLVDRLPFPPKDAASVSYAPNLSSILMNTFLLDSQFVS